MTDPRFITDDDTFIEIRHCKKGELYYSCKIEVSQLPDYCTKDITEKMTNQYAKCMNRYIRRTKIKNMLANINQSIKNLLAKIR
jgi:hypothetical protein